MKKIFLIISLFGIIFYSNAQLIYKTPESIQPLKVGEKVTDFELPNHNNESINLKQTLNNKPVVLIFYRAGWCPFCNIHLSEIQSIEDKIIKMGYQIIAISTDKADKLQETTEKNMLKYVLLSDPECVVAEKFGIAFWAGESWKLPVPSLFIIDKTGVIKFEYSDPDYKHRISAEAVLLALKNIK